MLRCSHFRLSLLIVSLGLIFASLAADAQQNASKRGRKYKSPPPTARIEVTVVRDSSGKPIENAAVIFHAMAGEKDKGFMELKTNEDGKAMIDVMPIGDTIRLQIIAKGFQTFGDDYKIEKAKMSIHIQMKRPGEQYSIYKNHPETSQGSKSPDAAKPANPAKDAAAPEEKQGDKPADSPSQPDQSQPQPK